MLAKHSKSFSLIDCISVGVDRMQRNFEPMRKQVEAWQRSELTDVIAKVVIYEAFVEGKLEALKHLARTVHDLYFEPKHEVFRQRTIWSLSNAFTSAFKERSHSTTQSDGQVGRIPGSPVLTIVPTRGAVRPTAPFATSSSREGRKESLRMVALFLTWVNRETPGALAALEGAR